MPKIIDAPPWLVSFMTPFIARMIVRELAKEHPDWGPEQIAAKLRADLGRDPGPPETKLLAEVLRRWPRVAARGARPTPRFSVSAGVLVAANLVALYGILTHGWDVFPLILLYWIENVVIGVLNVARMLCVDPEDRATWLGKLFTVPFFCVHYGMFTAIHGSLLLAFFGDYDSEGFSPLPAATQAVVDYGLGMAVAAVAASHLFSFFWNYLWRGEFRRASVSDLMEQPYHRVVLLHVVILAGGFAVAALGSPLWALLPLVAIKIALDVRAHLKEHR
jgi:hypothetical protein